MRKILRIAARDYNAAVRTKGFIFGLVIAPVMMCGGLVAFALFKDRVDTTDKRMAVIDRSGVVADHLEEETEKRNATGIFDQETGKKIRPAYLLERVAPDDENPEAQRLDLSNRVRTRKLFAFVEIGPSVMTPGRDPEGAYINFYSEQSALSDERGWMQGVINTRLRFLRGKEAGLDEETAKDIISWINITGLGLVTVDKDSGEVKKARRTNEGEALLVPLIMVMLMFMMMMMGAMPLVGAVLEEKMQRISEVLLGSIQPFGLMMGKLLGGVAVSLTGLVIYVVVGMLAAEHLELHDVIPYRVLPWFFFYMIVAIFMFGSLLAAVGAACNDQKEVQSIMPAIMLPMIIPMMVLVPVIKEPLSAFSTWMSLIPPFTPMMMLLRQATPISIPWWQPWAGIAGVVALTLFCVWAGGRIFRIGILMQGQPPRIGDLVRWVFRG
jgi:ABC-2 type transport system permease protein